MKDVSAFTEEIIHFQKKFNLTDADVAFGTHLSVEKIHRIKSNSGQPNPDDIRRIQEFIKSKK